jgi:anti-sigma regulatory factor (Ser/Thr protein kinase)
VAQAVASLPVPYIDSWARDALSCLDQVPAVRRVGLALAEGGGRRLLFAASDRDNHRGVAWCHVDAYDDVPLNTAVRTGEPVVGSLNDLAEHYPAFTGRQDPATVRAVAAFPISAAGQVLGGFVLFYDQPQGFESTQQTALQELGAQLGSRLRRAQRATTLPSRSLSDEPVAAGARSATYTVAGEHRAVAPARHFLRSTLAAWGLDTDSTETAILCLSELVTNAIIHTNSGCEFRVVLDDSVLTTTVRDSGPATAGPSGASKDPLAIHGRGLELVDALATRWGSELDALGTTVWFVLEPTSRPTQL